MEILLLNPPFLNNFSREQRSPAVTKSGTIYYPMWLSYATGLLEKKGFNATLIDGVVKNGENKLNNYITNNSPEMIVLSTSTPSIYNDLLWVENLKNKFPNSTTVLVGPHVSALPEEVIESNPSVDAIAIGEYEFTLLEIAKRIKDKNNLTGIAGIVHRKNSKIIRENHKKPHINLDEIPFVSKTYLKHLDYKDYFYAHSKYPIVTILSARGCPFNCTYCVYPQVFSGHKYRPREIEAVIEELEFIQANFLDVREIMFEDDTFIINEERTKKLAESIIKSKFNLPFSINSRADVSYETLGLLKRAGCRLMCVGVESGSQDILNNTRKKTERSEIERFFRDARRADILIHGCFMLGNPGETLKTVSDTLEFARKLSPDTAQFFPIMCYPGTEMYDDMKKTGKIITEDFSKWIKDNGMHNCIIKTDRFSADELVHLCDLSRKSFYINPQYILRKTLQSMMSFDEFYRNVKAFKKFITHLIKP
jgi:radical SAM superfamily enzyme YgiQ (UPF0313 family)